VTGIVARLKATSQHLCNIRDVHAVDYEECRLLAYKTPVHASLEIHYVSVTGPSRLMLCKI
jgi:hypothetical protein